MFETTTISSDISCPFCEKTFGILGNPMDVRGSLFTGTDVVSCPFCSNTFLVASEIKRVFTVIDPGSDVIQQVRGELKVDSFIYVYEQASNVINSSHTWDDKYKLIFGNLVPRIDYNFKLSCSEDATSKEKVLNWFGGLKSFMISHDIVTEDFFEC